MPKLFVSTCVSFGVVLLLGCQPTTSEPGEDEDLPAVPVEAEDAAQVMAEQICGDLFECACANTAAFLDQADCVERETEQLQIEFDTMLADGATWNAECAGELSKTWTKWACHGPTVAQRQSSYDPRVCPIVKGNLGLGANCFRLRIGDPCREGLACIDQICVESPTLPVPIGGVCELQWETLPCESGSYCAWNGEGQPTCVAVPQAGDPCDPAQDYLCGLSSHDLICDESTATCVSAPTTGEPCFDQFLCGPGNYCDGGKDFTCQPRRELGDGCGADAVCPVDASCVSNICTADQPAVCNLINWP
ncbi:Dickkopf N-terminal cysteine-rich domain-containing protein [Enhygromyxa salina]|uniref:Uncharacterized protein n=1 Tax=Enhygromyxa salina TaxID=215803 RepID=A0A2S9Y5P4_9BACT|nr:Dickkopf N-terminal cysteine-rich domain-containing protein [Enhygromyxa salina]PRQ00419.1 hypothetical protein ENSA7_59130 [Enhygromyxa salina]